MENPNDSLQGVCKDCGAGTLNNRLNPTFTSDVGDDGYVLAVSCLRCGSDHVDVVVL